MLRGAQTWPKRRVSVVVTLAIMAAAGAPLALYARKLAQRKACLNNLRQIDCVQVCCVPLANNLAFGDTMNSQECFRYIKEGACPVCPAGGTYDISWVVGGPYPKCTVHGNLLQQLYGDRVFKEGIRRREP